MSELHKFFSPAVASTSPGRDRAPRHFDHLTIGPKAHNGFDPAEMQRIFDTICSALGASSQADRSFVASRVIQAFEKARPDPELLLLEIAEQGRKSGCGWSVPAAEPTGG